MRLYIFLILLTATTFSSCEKNKLKQPAYLAFGWEFTNHNPQFMKANITNGFFYLDKFHVKGTRSSGPGVEIEQVLSGDGIPFTSGGSLGLMMDVPVGDYTSFEVGMNVEDNATPCLVFTGEFNTGMGMVPMRIEWSNAIELLFKTNQEFSLEKKETYNVMLGVDIEKLVTAVPDSIWNGVQIYQQNGTYEIVISEDFNHPIFNLLQPALTQALQVRVQ